MNSVAASTGGRPAARDARNGESEPGVVPITREMLEPALEPSVAEVLATGRYDGHVGFVEAHFHTAEELRGELVAAGLADVTVLGIEGPSWPALDAGWASSTPGWTRAALRPAGRSRSGHDPHERPPSRGWKEGLEPLSTPPRQRPAAAAAIGLAGRR